MLILFILLAVACYGVAAALQARYLFFNRSARHNMVIVLASAGLLCHAIALNQQFFTPLGLDFNLVKAASLIAWFIMLITLANCVRRPTKNMLIATCPLAAVSLLLSLFNLDSNQLDKQLSIGMFIHICSSILAYSVLFMATIQAVALQLQESELRHKHLSGFIMRLPPLQTMEAILFELTWVGVILLAVSLISGALYIDNLFAQHLIHKTVLTAAAYIIFSVLLWGRHQLGWRSYTATRWTIGGFILLMLGYFGSKLVLEIIL